jgi:Rrf2 family transcriptional regulator, iron-sulfur cluster assembly transcription factor
MRRSSLLPRNSAIQSENRRCAAEHRANRQCHWTYGELEQKEKYGLDFTGHEAAENGRAHELRMPLLPPKAALAVAAVTEMALNAPGRPVAARALATRLGLSPRSLEPVLQALVRHGILKGTRGPYGGYELAREPRSITANDILRAAVTAVELDSTPIGNTALLESVVLPVVRRAEEVFSAELARITVEDLAESAGELGRSVAE